MDLVKGSRIAISATLLVISAMLVDGQTTTPCSTSNISNFTPCFNFITGSTYNGSTPTSSCCNTLQSLTGTNVQCACLLVTANVPIPLPINRTLAFLLPRACNLAGLPLQCKASGTPLPAPGPISLGPTPAPAAIAASPFSPRASKAVALEPAPAPESETTPQLTPASPPVHVESPATTPRVRPTVNPSASAPSYGYPAPLLLLLVGITVFKSSY